MMLFSHTALKLHWAVKIKKNMQKLTKFLDVTTFTFHFSFKQAMKEWLTFQINSCQESQTVDLLHLSPSSASLSLNN